ncbi:MAG: serine/threonine-protein kinase, partial [Myxococcota bacterium]|nr:serine/threonine-protein kinase [Myxococcota bacterium]
MQETLQGKYRVLHEIGQGGMAVVYKGLDIALEREVAIKVLHPHLSNREDSRVRLQREAKAVARLHHPNILEIYDFSGLDSDKAYIVTEYIRGETLKDFTDRNTPSLPEVGAMVVHELALALAHAHDEGIIHRDIKPENIMIRDDGALKLMDFGIAQIVEMQNMTVTGALVGSPAHMSPEHVEGKTLDFRADVFSLGTLLYFLCAGRLPFDSPSPHALLRQILEAQYEDPRMSNPAVSRRLYRIIAKCLQREPNDRYATVLDLRDDLGAYLRDLHLDEPTIELQDYFESPAIAEAHLTRRVVERLIDLAKTAASEGKKALALEYYNQVLALQGDQEDALAQVRRLSSQASRNASLKRLALAISAALVAVGTASYLAMAPSPIGPAPRTSLSALDDTTLTSRSDSNSSDANRGLDHPPFLELRRNQEPMASVRYARRRAPAVAARPRMATALQGRRPLETAFERNRKVKTVSRFDRKRGINLPAAPAPRQPSNGVIPFQLRAVTGYILFDGKTYKNGFTPTLSKKPGNYSATVVPFDDTECCR